MLTILLILQRLYWPVPLDTLAIGHIYHTHSQTKGIVVYCRSEEDGDKHIKLKSRFSNAFIIAEIIPKLPLPCPKINDTITVQGITRKDPEHLWYEIHPVENWFK